jgi:hypothetical protein
MFDVTVQTTKDVHKGFTSRVGSVDFATLGQEWSIPEVDLNPQFSRSCLAGGPLNS